MSAAPVDETIRTVSGRRGSHKGGETCRKRRSAEGINRHRSALRGDDVT
jgi:hypothetical protein